MVGQRSQLCWWLGAQAEASQQRLESTLATVSALEATAQALDRGASSVAGSSTQQAPYRSEQAGGPAVAAAAASASTSAPAVAGPARDAGPLRTRHHNRKIRSELAIPEQLREFWFPALFSSHLKAEQMKPLRLFDEDWVLFRDSAGKACCLRVGPPSPGYPFVSLLHKGVSPSHQGTRLFPSCIQVWPPSPGYPFVSLLHRSVSPSPRVLVCFHPERIVEFLPNKNPLHLVLRSPVPSYHLERKEGGDGRLLFACNNFSLRMGASPLPSLLPGVNPLRPERSQTLFFSEPHVGLLP